MSCNVQRERQGYRGEEVQGGRYKGGIQGGGYEEAGVQRGLYTSYVCFFFHL